MISITQQAFLDVTYNGMSVIDALVKAKLNKDCTENDLQYIATLHESETIELTEVFGGVKPQSSKPCIEIYLEDLDDAILNLIYGNISAFQIGGFVAGRWSPNGIVRKWGNEPNFCQIKIIDYRGREGSGCYGDIFSSSSRKFLDHIVDSATITPDGKLIEFFKERNQALTAENCKPKFMAIM